MASGPDLFVVCKHCGESVSPYITECPYCGNRIQKRAPKLDRDQRIAEKPKRSHTPPSLPRLRRGEIPGIRPDAHPYATMLLIALGFVGTLLWRTGWVSLPNLIVFNNGGGVRSDWWHVFSAMFAYDNTGYAVITIGVIAIFGVLIERRHGPIVLVALVLVGGAGGLAVQSQLLIGAHDGGNGAAIALMTAWAIPDLIALSRGEDFEGDLILVGVLAVVVALMPVVTSFFGAAEAGWLPPAVGVGAGILIGYPLARLHPV